MKRFFIPLASLFSLVAPALTRAAPPIYPGVVPYEQLDTRNFYLGNYPILRIMPFMPKDTPPYLPVDTWSFAINTNLWTLYAYDPPNTTWHQVLGLGGITVTVNPTDTYIPYRANATTFLDSPWNVVATNKLGFYGPVSFLVYSNLSVGLGMNALVDNTGSQNVAIGDQALQLNTTGNGNVAIGNGALYAADTSYAIGIGVNALNAGSGSANIAIGHGAMATSPTAAYSVAIGEDSMEASTASYNTAVGHESGKTLGAGQYNTILGEASGGVTDGNANVVVGSSIGNVGATHEAKRSVVIGSGNANTTTNMVNSVIVGTAGDGASPRIATSSANLTNVIAIGYDIGITNSNQIVIGNSTNNRLNVPNMVYVDYSTKNTALGYGSQLGGGGGQNTSVGYQALPLAGNQNNDAFGNYALFSSTPSSDSSTALGGYSLYSLTNGTGNVAVGYDSQYYLTNGVYNTAVGFRSLEPNRDGNYNVAVGATTLFNEKHGGENVAVGYNALRNQNGQGGNTALGAFAGQNVAAQTNVIVIGHGASVTNDNEVVIGNTTNTKAFLPPEVYAGGILLGSGGGTVGGLWTNSPTGGGSLTASSNVIASLPTGLYGSIFNNSEDIFAAGENAGQGQAVIQSTNLYNIGLLSGYGMTGNEAWLVMNIGDAAGRSATIYNSQDVYNFGIAPGELAQITNGSWVVMNIGDNSGYAMVTDKSQDIFNYGWLSGDSMGVSNSIAIFNYGDWAGKNPVSTIQNSQDIFNYGNAAGGDQIPQNSTNLFNYGLYAGGAQFVQTVNSYYNYGTDSGYMGVGLASNSEELYNYGAWAGASLAALVADGTFVNFTNVYNYGPEAGMQIKGTNATYVLNYGYRAGEQSTMTGVSDLYNYGSDSGFQSTYDTSATDIYNYGTSAGKGASYTNSFFILNSGNSAGQSMVAQDSSSIMNLGSYAGANMVATNSSSIVNIGPYAGNLAKLTNSSYVISYGDQALKAAVLTNSSEVYAYGYQALYQAKLTNSSQIYAYGNNAGASLAGDGYSDIYLFGTAQPTRKTNEFVFGSANDLYTFPGTNATFAGRVDIGTNDTAAALHLFRVPANNGLEGILVNGTLFGTDVFGHAYSDMSLLNIDGTTGGYASFDADADFNGTATTLDHFYGFQSRIAKSGTGQLSAMASFRAIPSVNSPLDTLYGMKIDDALGVGAVTNDYGFYMGNITRGSLVNWSLFINSDANNYMKADLRDDTGFTTAGYVHTGVLGVGTNTPTQTVEVLGQSKFNGDIGIGAMGTGSSLYVAPVLSTNINNQYGVHIEEPSGSGVITNQYGLYIGNITKGTAAKWAVFVNSTANNYFSSDVKSDIGFSSGNYIQFLPTGASAAIRNWFFMPSYNDFGDLAIQQSATKGGAVGASVTRIEIDHAGQVGIATNAPSERLEVLGNIKASGKALLKGGVQDGYTNVLTSATGKDFFYVSVPNTNGIGGHVVYTVFATDGTDVQEISGDVKFAAVAKGTTVTATTADVQSPAALTGGSTLTAALAANTSTNNVFALGVTATTSLTSTNLVIKWRVETPSTMTINAIP